MENVFSESVSCELDMFFLLYFWHRLPPSGDPPYDGTARNQTHPNHLAVVSIYSVAAIAGIVYAIVCLLFNLVFRNKRYT